MPGPYRSKLKEYQGEIAQLRKTVPPTPYAEIQKILKEKHGVQITAGSIWAFVKARSVGHGRKLKYVMAEQESPIASSTRSYAPITNQTELPARTKTPDELKEEFERESERRQSRSKQTSFGPPPNLDE